MNLNSIIFPAPTEDKEIEMGKYKEELIFIPKKQTDGSIFHIPCLLQMSRKKPDTNKFLFYFHGNAEDIFNSTSNLEVLRNSLPFNTLGIEYPGYSIYYKEKSAQEIENDSLIVFDYLVNKMGVNPKDIVICGRSIGSGPAVYLSANRKPSALILISPFKSIQETAASIVGVFKFLIADRFNNYEVIGNVTCPTLFIHGQNDNLISFSHSVDLSKRCGGPYELILPEEMDHNEFNIYDDFLEPIMSFLKRQNLNSSSNNKVITIPSELFSIPLYLQEASESLKKTDYVSSFLRKILKI